jgi:hypothetical protein
MTKPCASAAVGWRCAAWEFHPDTRGADYSPPLPPEMVAKYDEDMEMLFGLGDPYAFGIAAMEERFGKL